MKTEEFEQRLGRQPWREVPPAWRREILAAARPSAPPARASAALRLREQLAFLLWPSPRAWAAVAVVWLFILAGNLLVNHEAPPTATQPLDERHLAESLRQRQRVLAELLEPGEPAESPSASQPSPRGEWRGTNRIG